MNRRTSTQLGQDGESIAADALRARGYTILHQNYKTPRYEIDLIAKKDKVIYFVEVKYRSFDAQGKGYEYVTSQKFQQMVYAAQSWCGEHQYNGDYQLIVISIDGKEITIIDDIWL